MRTLHVVEAASAGVGRHVLDLTAELVERDVEVTLLFDRRRADQTFLERVGRIGLRDVVEITTKPPRRWAIWSGVRAVRNLTTDDVDLVHGHSSLGGAWARLGASKRVRVIYTPNAFAAQSPTISVVRRQMYALAERAMSHRTDGYIAVSEEESRHATEMGIQFADVAIIPNGIPEQSTSLTQVQARELLGLPLEGRVVGFVGRLEKQKGVDVILRSAHTIHESTGATVAIVGDGREGPALEQLAKRLGVAHLVRWLGYHEGRAIMPAFDVLALPSRYEGFPYVALEALAAGVPLVASPSANVSQLIGDGRAGIISDIDTAAFGGAVAAVLLDDRRRRSMAAAGPEIASSYNTRTMALKTLSFYEQVLAVEK